MFITCGTKLHRQIVVIPMGINSALFVVNLILLCYDRDFLMSLPDENQADIIEAYNSTTKYLDSLCNIYIYFEEMVDPTKLKLNKDNSYYAK